MASIVIPGGGTGADTAGNFHWKAPVANVAALPASGNSYGDARVTLDTGGVYVWVQGTPDAWQSSTQGEAATVVETVGSGTDYTLTTTPTLVAFGGGNLELTIADAGTYDVEIGVFEDLSAVTASATPNGAFIMAALDTGGGYGAPFALRVTSSIPALAAAVAGITGKSSYFARGGLSGVVCGAGDKIGVLAATAQAVTGNWVLKADQTSGACSYIRATKVA